MTSLCYFRLLRKVTIIFSSLFSVTNCYIHFLALFIFRNLRWIQVVILQFMMVCVFINFLGRIISSLAVKPAHSWFFLPICNTNIDKIIHFLLFHKIWNDWKLLLSYLIHFWKILVSGFDVINFISGFINILSLKFYY